jgi:putative hydrolase of the HAD superfamily
MIRALLFDLDDTLYRERDFVAGGYQAVAEHVCTLSHRPFREVYGLMMETLATKGRDSVMETVQERFPVPPIPVEKLVDIYRRHTPGIRLYPGYEALLREFGRKYRLGIITDGAPEVQQRKCRVLGLEDLVDRIVYTWQHGIERQKPHPYPFRMMLSCLNVRPSEALFIGNSFEKDCCGARRAEIRGVLVQENPLFQIGTPDLQPDFVIRTLFQIPALLTQLGDQDYAA